MSSAAAPTAAATPPRRKKNAAAQFRSRRTRISHPLFDSPGNAAASSSTPPHNTHVMSTVTPEMHPSSQDPPALIDALKMAARPSAPEPTGGSSDGGGEAPRASYASSIEAMAAHVEASHVTKRRNGKSKVSSKMPRKNGSGGSSNGSLGSGGGVRSPKRKSSGSSSRSAPKSPGRTRKSSPRPPPQNKMWLIAVPILLPFLVCETFLLLLVFRFKDSATTGSMLVSTPDVEVGVPKIAANNSGPVLEEAVEKLPGGVVELEDTESEKVEADNEQTRDIDLIEQEESDTEEEPMEGMGIEEMDVDRNTEESELLRMKSMLEEGFAKLKGSVAQSGEGISSRKYVESLCGDVWVVANEMLSLESLEGTEGTGSEMTLAGLSKTVPASWKSLALDAQHCLGGAGLAFLDRDDVDGERLRVSTKVFDRLSHVEPHDPDVRAGLGTSLLIQGIFDISYSKTKDGHDGQRSLLALAAYHLKVASSLCSSSHSKAVRAALADADMAPAVSRLTKDDGDVENVASHAAILHNLALAYLALGDTNSSVPILLKAAALCREHSLDGKPYWNAPNDVLQAAEEKALLFAAKPKKVEPAKEKRRRRRIPFLPLLSSEDLDIDEMVGI